MPGSSDLPGREHPSTYFVQDQQSEAEINRLAIQDQLITTAMGGVMPEQTDAPALRRVLDVACGPGGWAVETARTYPDLSLIGIDINQRMVISARKRAEICQLADRVSFHSMDALRMLEFPPASFDLVNLRLSIGFLRTWDWPGLLREMVRVTRPRGIIRLTEPELIHRTTSPALMRWQDMLMQAWFRAGHLFAAETAGVTAHLEPLLQRCGCGQVQTRTFALTFRAGTAEGEALYEDAYYLFQTARPFLQKWGTLSDDYQDLCQQVLQDIRRDGFQASWNFLTAWGVAAPRRR
ncbi:MAG TPA: methyltransferase domain-containing protein [Ktedonobacteraceae bacterium]